MIKFHESLSERSVYLRYFRAFQLSQRVEHERLTRISFIDYDRTMALVAERHNPETNEDEIVAVGRLTKARGTNEAEYALLVSDEFQGRGLGTELLSRLLQIARDEGVGRVTAYMLPENRGIINISKKLGFRIEREAELVKAVIEL
jgi:acetyltransferase